MREINGTLRVAVFPCASGIGQEIFHALSGHKDVVLHGVNAGRDNTGSVLFGNRYVGGAPPISESDALIAFLNSTFHEHDISYIFPAYDDATVWLRRHADELDAVVIAPGSKAVDTCRSKLRTYKMLSNVLSDTNVRIPKIFNPDSVTLESLPVFIKPDAGEGSKRCRQATTLDDVRNIADDEICVEYFPGTEYTVDCFTSADGETASFPRTRHGVRSGLSVHTKSVDETVLHASCAEAARSIAASMDMRGAWFFQCRGAEGGDLGLLEVAPRIAGAMALRRHAGVNFPLLTLYLFAGVGSKVSPSPGDPPSDVIKIYQNHIIFDRDFTVIYCDLDDTLIKNGKVCPDTISFLYRWRATKSVILLTRHAGDVDETLAQHRVCRSLFDEVVHIRETGTPKSEFVQPGSLFIDDSYSERQDVQMRVPSVVCLDVDTLSSKLIFRT